MARKILVSRMENAPVLLKGQYTEKQEKYMKGILEGKIKKEAKIIAGYSEKNSKVETPLVKQGISQLLDKAGLTDEALTRDLRRGLKHAKKFYGNGENMIEKPDYAIRHKYLETALKLRGRLQGEEKQGKDPIQILIVDYDANKNKSTT